MSCCYDSAKYAPLETTLEATRWHQYPGDGRTSVNQPPPHDSVLVKTGGNALAAIDKDIASSTGIAAGDTCLLLIGRSGISFTVPVELTSDVAFSRAVSVPDGAKPGQQIYVTAPDGSGRYVSATVPEGALPGHTFLVKFPPCEPLVATGVPVENADDTTKEAAVLGEDVDQHNEEDLLLTVDLSDGANNDTGTYQNRVLVQVPPGALPGSKIRTQVLVGSENVTVEAAVPEGNVSQFYIDIPPSQPREELILVQVPPGVAPGSTIHVTLPPDQIIEAVVPPGNVSQFYVRAPAESRTNRNQSTQNQSNSSDTSGSPVVVLPIV